jgi:hypothetical protein
MQIDELLLIAPETINKVTYCFAVTAAENGELSGLQQTGLSFGDQPVMLCPSLKG